MTNFHFLKQPFSHLFNHATQAEKLIFTDARGSCLYARFTLEQAVEQQEKLQKALKREENGEIRERILILLLL